MVTFITEFVILDTFIKYGLIVSCMEEFKRFFSIPLFTTNFRPKIVSSIMRVKMMYASIK